MTADPEPPIHPDVLDLIAGITEMADQIRRPFVADPEQVRIFNAAYLDSMTRGEFGIDGRKPNPTD